jgi:hypothetical protein
MLCGAKSVYAIAQWGRLQDPKTVESLGFSREKTPSGSTLHEVFSRLDVEAFEAALSDWSQAYSSALLTTCLGDKEAIAIDGKGLRGIHGEELPGVRLVAAYAHKAALVVAQKGGKGH